MKAEWTYEIDPVFGCWLWAGSTNADGYPTIWGGQKPRSAHKVIYEATIGPVADGLVLDHLCRVRICVRPLHLEPITQRENLLRRDWRWRCKRTKCVRGHDMAHAIVTPTMGRLCRVCAREAT